MNNEAVAMPAVVSPAATMTRLLLRSRPLSMEFLELLRFKQPERDGHEGTNHERCHSRMSVSNQNVIICLGILTTFLDYVLKLIRCVGNLT
ncbi:hypothetical protein CXQ84_11000 [Burkholderia pseudomallei]|nr:hypothetical protein CXQ84_11000 [Burkholderia pseudomallei]